MSQFVMSRRMFAGVPVIMATATVPLAEPSQPRHIVAFGQISRRGGRVVISDRLAGSEFGSGQGWTVTAMCDLNESHLALGRITDALFCSELVAGVVLTSIQVGQAVNEALSAHRDWNGLTRAVRAAFARRRPSGLP